LSRTRRWVSAATAALLLITVALWIALPTHDLTRTTATLLPTEQIYSTAVGEHRHITLSDGSGIELNTATHLRVRFTERSRQVILDDGEALFFVHHDTSRPFNVSAGGTLTRDIGTTFNVLSVGGRTQITVLEGRVQVSARPLGSITSAQPGTLVLSVGESTNYSVQGGLSPATSGELERIASWQSGRVEFRDAPLADALSDFNRYSETRIVVGDASLNAIHLSGVFRAGDVQALTRALASAFHIRSTPDPDSRTVVLIGAGAGH
jgi:transmembrane sensor